MDILYGYIGVFDSERGFDFFVSRLVFALLKSAYFQVNRT